MNDCYTLRDCPLNTKLTIAECDCEERFCVMGIREGEEVEFVKECPFGGTVICKTRLGSLCFRRSELNLVLVKH